jgi:tetratricopeptide (TPR) repeat protein
VPLGTEAALKSVEDYFPPEEDPVNEYYVRLSKLRLAEMHVASEEFDKAKDYYKELANSESTEPQFTAFGLAGLANVYLLQGEVAQARRTLALALPLYDKLSRELREELRRQLEPDLWAHFETILREDRGGDPSGRNSTQRPPPGD